MPLDSGHIFENTKVDVILIKEIFEFILANFFFEQKALSKYFKHTSTMNNTLKY